MIGLLPDTYEAWCFDEAVIYFGLTFEGMLDEAGHKPDKAERKAKAARERVMGKVFSPEKKQGSGFADPASMFM